MSISNIPVVDFLLSGSCKFVLISGPDKKWFFYGRQGAGFDFHKNVFEQFLVDAKSFGAGPENFKCKGGGWITINSGDKTVTVWGRSKNYGKYDPLIVKILLSSYVEKYLKGFTLIVKAV